MVASAHAFFKYDGGMGSIPRKRRTSAANKADLLVDRSI